MKFISTFFGYKFSNLISRNVCSESRIDSVPLPYNLDRSIKSKYIRTDPIRLSEHTFLEIKFENLYPKKVDMNFI
jgi:hypothetical protein